MILQSQSWAYTKEKCNSKKDTHTPVFTAALCTTTRTWKQPECPSTKAWIKKIWYIYTMEYYSAIKRKLCHVQRHGWTSSLSYRVK